MPWAPHAALARHCALFVHHGGAGTSHAALRAGLPSLVLPFIFEQGLWAKRLRQVGAAEQSPSFWRAKPQQVASRIRGLLVAQGPQRRAAQLASELAREDGAAMAIQRLVQLFE